MNWDIAETGGHDWERRTRDNASFKSSKGRYYSYSKVSNSGNATAQNAFCGQILPMMMPEDFESYLIEHLKQEI